MTQTEDQPRVYDRRDTRKLTAGKIRHGIDSHIEWIADRARYLTDKHRAELLELAGGPCPLGDDGREG